MGRVLKLPEHRGSEDVIPLRWQYSKIRLSILYKPYNPNCLFCRNWQADPKIIWKFKEPWISKTIFKKKTKLEDFHFLISKLIKIQYGIGIKIDIWINLIELEVQKLALLLLNPRPICSLHDRPISQETRCWDKGKWLYLRKQANQEDGRLMSQKIILISQCRQGLLKGGEGSRGGGAGVRSG